MSQVQACHWPRERERERKRKRERERRRTSGYEPFERERERQVDLCGSEAGSYLRPIDFVHHSTLGLRVTKKKKKDRTLASPKLISQLASPKLIAKYPTPRKRAVRRQVTSPSSEREREVDLAFDCHDVPVVCQVPVFRV